MSKPMTNYNERLDSALSDYAEAICSYAYFGSPLNSDEENIAGAEGFIPDFTKRSQASPHLTHKRTGGGSEAKKIPKGRF